jgi:hypothetical protein
MYRAPRRPPDIARKPPPRPAIARSPWMATIRIRLSRGGMVIIGLLHANGLYRPTRAVFIVVQ